MLKGEKISLHAIEEEDLRTLLSWRNNTGFRKYFREYRELNMKDQKLWYKEKVIEDPTVIMFSIKNNETGELLGCCGFVYINWVHRHADLSLYIGWKDAYIDEKGYAEESCQLLLDYGFKELCLNKVWTEIYEFDEKKKTLYEKFGFYQDGLLRQNYWYDGKWWNARILSILSGDYSKSI